MHFTPDVLAQTVSAGSVRSLLPHSCVTLPDQSRFHYVLVMMRERPVNPYRRSWLPVACNHRGLHVILFPSPSLCYHSIICSTLQAPLSVLQMRSGKDFSFFSVPADDKCAYPVGSDDRYCAVKNVNYGKDRGCRTAAAVPVLLHPATL